MKKLLLGLGVLPLTILPITMSSCQVVKKQEEPTSLGILLTHKEDKTKFFYPWSNIVWISHSIIMDREQVIIFSSNSSKEWFYLNEWTIEEGGWK